MPVDPVEEKQDLRIGHHVYVGDRCPPFIGELVRFKGNSLGVYTVQDSIDDSRLKRTLTECVLFRCPGGYEFTEASCITGDPRSGAAGKGKRRSLAYYPQWTKKTWTSAVRTSEKRQKANLIY